MGAESASGPRPDLTLLFPDEEGHPIVFTIPEGTTTLGSASDNDLVLEDPSISPHQIVLVRDGDELTLQDLFAGETRVNGEVRRKGMLSPGDVLKLGEVKLRVMRVAATRNTKPLARDRATTRRLRVSGLRARVSLDGLPPPTRGPEAGTDRQARTSELIDLLASAPAPPAKDDPDAETRQAPSAAQAPHPAPAPKESEEARLAQARDARRARALARGRQLADELMVQDDFEILLERLALGFLDVFSADRAVTVLFEEDGRNPLLTIERRRDGTDEGTGVAQEIIDRCLQVRTVIRVAGALPGHGGLAAPLIASGRALGLLYFERTTTAQALDADDVHIMALLTNLASLLIAPLVD